MYRRTTSLFVFLCFTTGISGCTSTRRIPKDEISRLKGKSSVVVTLVDGRQCEVKEPKVEGSVLVGYVEPDGHREIDLEQIESLAITDLDKTRTIALGVWGALATGILIYILSDGESSKEPCPT